MRKLIFLSLLLVMGIHAGYAQDDDLPPYLYYYSDVLNAFVIERADGTDSRVFADGIMPDGTNIANADWSPSGEWLAWRSGQVIEPGGNIHFDGWIMKTDGSERLNFLDEVSVDLMAWSPTQDLLFVVAYERQDLGNYIFYLINATEKRVVISFALNNDTYFGGQSVRWMPNGEIVAFNYYIPSQEDRSSMQSFIRTITGEGVIHDQEVHPLVVSNGDFWSAANLSLETGNNLYLTQAGAGIVIENLYTGETRELDNPTESARLKAEWNSTGEFALVFVEYACESLEVVCAELWLLSMEPLEMVHITDTAAYASGYWSPVNDTAHFSDVDGNSFLFNAVSGEIVPIEGLEDIKTVHWSPDGRHLLAIADNYYLLELESLQVQDVTPANLRRSTYEASFSPSGRYLAVAYPLHLIDLESGQVRSYNEHSSAIHANTHSFHYVWSINQEWILFNHIVFHAGGGGGPRANIVTNVDGSIQRELTRTFNEADWLPENVVPYLATGSQESVLQQPVRVLAHDYRIMSFDWNVDSSLNIYDSEAHGYLWDLNQDALTEISMDGIANLTTPTPYTKTNLQVSNPVYPLSAIAGAQGGTLDGIEIIDLISQEVVSGIFASDVLDLYDMEWTPDGESLIITGQTGIGIWDRRDMQFTHLEGVRSTFMPEIAISPDSQLLVGASRYVRVNIWNLTTKSFITQLNWFAEIASFSPDNRYLALGNGSLISIWSVNEILERAGLSVSE